MTTRRFQSTYCNMAYLRGYSPAWIKSLVNVNVNLDPLGHRYTSLHHTSQVIPVGGSASIMRRSAVPPQARRVGLEGGTPDLRPLGADARFAYLSPVHARPACPDAGGTVDAVF